MDNIQSGLKALIEKRTDEIGIEIRRNDKYRKCDDEIKSLYRQIYDVLPDKHKKLIQEFDTAANYQQAIAEQIYYSQGMKDGIEFKKQLTELSI